MRLFVEAQSLVLIVVFFCMDSDRIKRMGYQRRGRWG